MNACVHVYVYVCLYRESMCAYMCVYRDRVCVCILRTCVCMHMCVRICYHSCTPYLLYFDPRKWLLINFCVFLVPPLLGLVHVHKYWYPPFEVMVCYCSNSGRRQNSSRNLTNQGAVFEMH